MTRTFPLVVWERLCIRQFTLHKATDGTEKQTERTFSQKGNLQAVHADNIFTEQLGGRNIV